MAVLPIRLFPDPTLRRLSKPIAPLTVSRSFLKDLIETMYAQPSGIGIAAPQVGEAQQIIVIDVSPRDPSKGQLVMLNPKIIHREGSLSSREGCMSLPDYTADLIRFANVTVEWRDVRGKRRTRSLSGIESICAQHEIDHLVGRLIIDRVWCLKTDVIPRRAKS